MASATITIDITARLASLEQGLARTESAVNKMGSAAQKGFNGAGIALKGLLVAAISLESALQFGAGIKQVIDLGDKIDDLAEKSGIGAEKLSQLRYAAEVGGTPFEALETGLKKLALSIVEAQNKTSEQAAAFKALGIETKDATGKLKGTDDVLLEVASRFSSYADGANKVALATTLMGRNGDAMIPILNKGAEGIRDLAAEGNALGASFGSDFAKKAADFNDNLKRIELAAQGARIEIAGPLITALDSLAKQFIEARRQGLSFWQALDTIGYGRGFTKEGQLERESHLLDELKQKRAELARSPGPMALFGDKKLDGQIAEQEKRVSVLRAQLPNRGGSPVAAALFGDAGYAAPNSKPQAPTASKPAAAAKIDPFRDYITGLNRDAEKLNFTIANFERFKGASDTSREALVRFDVEFGKLSDASRRADGLVPLTAQQKELAVQTGITVAKLGEQLQQTKALSAFDERIKQIELETKMIGQSNIEREVALALFDLEREHVDKGTEAYKRREVAVRQAITAGTQAREDLDVRAFHSTSTDSLDQMRFELSLTGQTRAAVEDLTAARQIDLAVKRAIFNDDGTQRVTDATAAAYRSEGEAMKRLTITFNAERRALQLDAMTGAKSFLVQYVDEVANAAQSTHDLLSNAFQGAEDALVRFVTTGKLDFRSFVDSIIADLARMTIRKQITAPLAAALSSGLGGSPLGIAGTNQSIDTYDGPAYTDFFSRFIRALPSFAVGTDYVPRDMMAMIHKGERVVPAAQNRSGGAAAGPMVTLNQVNNFPADVDPAKMALYGQRIKEATLAAMNDQLRRGGALARAAGV